MTTYLRSPVIKDAIFSSSLTRIVTFLCSLCAKKFKLKNLIKIKPMRNYKMFEIFEKNCRCRVTVDVCIMYCVLVKWWNGVINLLRWLMGYDDIHRITWWSELIVMEVCSESGEWGMLLRYGVWMLWKYAIWFLWRYVIWCLWRDEIWFLWRYIIWLSYGGMLWRYVIWFL